MGDLGHLGCNVSNKLSSGLAFQCSGKCAVGRQSTLSVLSGAGIEAPWSPSLKIVMTNGVLVNLTGERMPSLVVLVV